MKKYDVVIVGLGPTGGTLANLLALNGFSILILEREKSIYSLPRAVHFDDEIMRVFQTIGITKKFLKNTIINKGTKFVNSEGKVLLDWPRPRSITENGWYPSYRFHQPDLERNLRNQLREDGSTFNVVKNSLAKIAVTDSKVKDLSAQFKGPMAIVFSEQLSSQPKILSDFSKENENLSIVGGFMDGEIIDKETVSKLASLPSLETLRAKIIGSLASSAQKIAVILNKPGGQIAQIISAKSQSDGAT